MKVVIGIIIVVAIGYFLYDSGAVSTSDLSAIKDTAIDYYTKTKDWVKGL